VEKVANVLKIKGEKGFSEGDASGNGEGNNGKRVDIK
jgi:hypothetical protein